MPDFGLEDSLDSPRMGAFFVNLFQFFNISGVIDTRVQVTNRMRPLMEPDMRDAFFPPTGSRPGVWIGSDAIRQVIIIDGVRTNAQAIGLIEGYPETPSTFTFQGRNPWLFGAGRFVDDNGRVQAIDKEPFRRLIVGYSAGGAVAMWVAKRGQETRNWFSQRILSFGSPRAMSLPDLESINAFESQRWMCDTDPVPLIPPRFEDATILALALGVNATLVNGTYVHKNPGFSLAPDGTATFSTLPQIAQADVTGSLANWYFSKTNDPNNTHSFREYGARLEALAQLQRPRVPVPPRERVAEPAENAPRREIRAAAARTEAQIARASLIQNQTAVEVNKTVLFKSVRFDRVWCVAFGDQIVCFAGNKKRARHLARVGNDFLRSLPKQAVVDADSLVNQFSAFMNAAVVPGGPVTPPIRIGL